MNLKMKTKTRKELIEEDWFMHTILQRMCEAADVCYEDVDFDDKDWFRKHEWTEEQQDKFVEQLTQFILFCGKTSVEKIARDSAQFLMLDIGWKLKN